MMPFINSIRPVALYLLVLISGIYAGLHFSGMINPLVFGIINAKGDLMNSVDWAKSWQITDGFMRVRMEVFGPIILFGYIIALLLFINKWRTPIFWLILAALGLFIADVMLTGNQQIPINRYIETLDFQHLTAEQVAKINEMHPQVIKNFQSREWFSILGFVLVALTPFVSIRHDSTVQK
ncbi:hypothetical protein [Runella aurantiaca]|uniref:DUF1772 domain-containing protein n=1 Tax=Runella aurantiaca TaxID=2282308 RepID=A0A369IFI9_9BACT|nr:hypothetical protein [Runella aurantiaca]RDB05984.1 hypothetical protein DVG78_11295 [Runella aurantiaca]